MPQILLVEDNKANQVVAVGILRKLGYDVDIVEDGGEAVASCLLHRYRAILMDVMMPRVDGYEATAQIRENDAALGFPRTVIIGCSARAMDGDREVALAAGMDEYLTKPLRTAELRRALDRWVGPPVALQAHGSPTTGPSSLGLR